MYTYNYIHTYNYMYDDMYIFTYKYNAGQKGMYSTRPARAAEVTTEPAEPSRSYTRIRS